MIDVDELMQLISFYFCVYHLRYGSGAFGKRVPLIKQNSIHVIGLEKYSNIIH